ncbi:hypothetical protein ACEQ8H_000180 [Pleosporales sp. CAS-2024a]
MTSTTTVALQQQDRMAARPVQDSRVLSHGRGGAGNLVKDDPTANYPKPQDLATPTLKGATYTTGRGGTGNMAQNDPDRPDVARAAQDVEGPGQVLEPTGPTHYGRGGAANITETNGERKSGHVQRNKSVDGKPGEDNAKGGLLAKGKNLLNRLGKK